eukprot:2810045-Rhodomonas_salina.1
MEEKAETHTHTTHKQSKTHTHIHTKKAGEGDRGAGEAGSRADAACFRSFCSSSCSAIPYVSTERGVSVA